MKPLHAPGSVSENRLLVGGRVGPDATEYPQSHDGTHSSQGGEARYECLVVERHEQSLEEVEILGGGLEALRERLEDAVGALAVERVDSHGGGRSGQGDRADTVGELGEAAGVGHRRDIERMDRLEGNRSGDYFWASLPPCTTRSSGRADGRGGGVSDTGAIPTPGGGESAA